MKKTVAFLLILSLLMVFGVSCDNPPQRDDAPSRDDDTGNTTPPKDETVDQPDAPSSPSGGEDDPSDNPDISDDTTGGDPTPPDEPDAPAEPDPSVPSEPTMPTLPADAINAVTDWGVSTAAGAGIANGVLLYEKISRLGNGATVFFPEGIYELDLPLSLSGKKNIRIVGYKAVFLNTRATNTSPTQSASTDPLTPTALQAATATSGMVWIEGSQNVTVEGITFRYACPTSLSGEVSSKTSSYADIRITDGSVLTGREYVMAINTFTSAGVPDRTLEQYAATCFPVEKINDTTLRVSGINTANLKAGTRVCLRTSLSSNYVFTIFNSSDLTFRNLTLNNSLNGGFLIEHRTVNATFDGVRVQSHNPHALMSLNADALHIAGLGGELVVNNCYFERGGDDFINVHGIAAKPTAVSENSLDFTLSWGADSRWAAVGDTIEFYDPASFSLLGSAKITAVNGATLTFDALPTGVTTSTVLSNLTLHPTVRVTDTHARYNRARAFLLQTDDITIKNCHFYATSLAAILIAPDINNWMEMSPAENVIISECTFDSCGSEANGVIQFAVDHDNLTSTTPAPIHIDILISGCKFVSTVPALYAVACRYITFTDNIVTDVAGSNVAVFISCNNVIYDASLHNRVYTRTTTDITEK